MGVKGGHGVYGVGQTNLERRILLVLFVRGIMCVKTWPKKNEKRKVTIRMS